MNKFKKILTIGFFVGIYAIVGTLEYNDELAVKNAKKALESAQQAN